MPLTIQPYIGFGRFGRENELVLRGRVLVDKRISRATEAEPVWRNVLNTYRRFQSDEVSYATVLAQHRDAVAMTQTDEEGYFEVRLDPHDVEEGFLWHDVDLELPDHGIAEVGRVMVPVSAPFGVISDIDDTIVQTGATSLLRMVRSVMLQNAAMRPAFEGVAELYRELHGGWNPIFYVSSSPWNLYELLHDFMALTGIPLGPMFLQDWGIDGDKFISTAHETHKLAQIQLLFDYYPDLPFILIGDSGQHDPEIYLQAIRMHGQRVKAVFIRDVTDERRDRAVNAIGAEATEAGVPFHYVRDSAEALEHARGLGLV